MAEAPPANPRGIAASVIADLLSRRGSLTALLPAASATLAPQDRSFVAELCYGTARYYHRLQALLDQMLARPLKTKDSDIRALLLIGLYQLDYLRVPDHAAVSATVAAANDFRKPWAKGLINGVLRKYLRSGAALRDALEPAAAASHPDWLWRLLQAQWPERWQDITAANNAAPPMTLRVNALKVAADEYQRTLAAAGLQSDRCTFSPWGLQLATPCDVQDLPGFAEGLCSVQDEASQLAAPLLGPAAGQRLLDCCCAPGGKTGHLLELGGTGLQLDAVELDAQRLGKVASNLARLALEAHLIQADATRVSEWWCGERYDGILLDAPCSATGVIRRHPDIKLLREYSDIARLASVQATLLKAVWQCLKPGATLIYSTCSVLREENDDVIEGFVRHCTDARPEALDGPWGLATSHGRQLLPVVGGHDGFYYAKLRKS